MPPLSLDKLGPMSAARGTGGALVAILAVLVAPGILSASAAATPAAISEPAAIAVVVPITARASETGMLDADTLALLTSPTGALSRTLDDVLASSATIALDPMIVASIRALGTTAPESAVEWLDRLESASNEVFLLAYADADLSALARGDDLDLAAPLGFDFALDPSAFDPAQTATPTDPTPSATPDEPDEGTDDAAPPLPTTEELLAWPSAIGPIAWPAEGSATTGDLAAYQSAGYAAVLLSSANVSETASSGVSLGALAGLVAHTAASELLREASAAVDPALRRAAIDRLGLALDGLAAAHPGRTIVLTIDRSASPAINGFAETYAALGARASTRLTNLAEVLTDTAQAASVVDGAPAGHIEVADRIADAARAEDAFATILADPLQLTAPHRLQLLALLAVQDVDRADWADRARDWLRASTQTLGAVGFVDSLPLLVTSTSTTLPIVISNGLDFAVTVRLDATATRPFLTIDSPREVTIEPGSSKTVRLDAQAVTNGVVDVRLTLSSPVNGQQIGDTRVVEARLEAQWETVGLIGGAVIGLIFAVGIVRNIVLRRRRAVPDRTEPAAE